MGLLVEHGAGTLGQGKDQLKLRCIGELARYEGVDVAGDLAVLSDQPLAAVVKRLLGRLHDLVGCIVPVGELEPLADRLAKAVLDG